MTAGISLPTWSACWRFPIIRVFACTSRRRAVSAAAGWRASGWPIMSESPVGIPHERRSGSKRRRRGGDNHRSSPARNQPGKATRRALRRSWRMRSACIPDRVSLRDRGHGSGASPAAVNAFGSFECVWAEPCWSKAPRKSLQQGRARRSARRFQVGGPRRGLR